MYIYRSIGVFANIEIKSLVFDLPYLVGNSICLISSNRLQFPEMRSHSI